MSTDEILKSNFPLYDLLTEKTNDAVLSPSDMVSYINNIKLMDKRGYDLLFVIIRIYSIKNVQNINVSDVPFSGQKIEDQTLNKTDVKFDIRNFPNKLNQMLFEFTKLHIISKQ